MQQWICSAHATCCIPRFLGLRPLPVFDSGSQKQLVCFFSSHWAAVPLTTRALHDRKVSKWTGAGAPTRETRSAFCRAVNTDLFEQTVCKLQVPRRENPDNKTWTFLSLEERHHREKQQRADVLSNQNKPYMNVTLECDQGSRANRFLKSRKISIPHRL